MDIDLLTSNGLFLLNVVIKILMILHVMGIYQITLMVSHGLSLTMNMVD